MLFKIYQTLRCVERKFAKIMKGDIMSVSEQEKVRLFQCERRKEIMLAVIVVIEAGHFFMVVTIIFVVYYGAYHIRERMKNL